MSVSVELEAPAHHGLKDVPWYKAQLDDLGPECRELLEKYSQIAPERVKAHILEVRERAWSVFPYPCLGQFRFLDLSISLHPSYQRVLSCLKQTQANCLSLGLACCFAQDVRKLIYDGVPSENLYACSLRPEYMELSYDLFADRNTMKAKFFVADVFEEPGSLDDLYGRIDIIHAASFFHLFSWDDQLKLCKRVIKILKPRKGSLIFGRQTGDIQGREIPLKTHGLKEPSFVWWHEPGNFRRMWDLAGLETGTKWDVGSVGS